MSGGPGVVISGLSDPLNIEDAEEETNDQSARRNNRQGPVKVLSQRMAEGPDMARSVVQIVLHGGQDCIHPPQRPVLWIGERLE